MGTEQKRCTAVMLAAGRGTRMGGPVPKQYMDLCGKPLAAWTLRALAASPVITDLVLVIPEGDEAYVRGTIIPAADELLRENRERNEDRKSVASIKDTAPDPAALEGVPTRQSVSSLIRALVPGGRERYLSVLNGLQAIDWTCDYVFIHDGARPFIDPDSIERLYGALENPANGGAAVAAMPSKDTVKIVDDQGFVERTPDRRKVWIIQTPQAFETGLIREAYEEMDRQQETLKAAGISITDDAMLVERLLHRRVKLVEASYRNIKVTTPEDLLVAEAFIREEQE